jgi:hypothetical protein
LQAQTRKLARAVIHHQAGARRTVTVVADDIAGIQAIYGVFDTDFDDDGILNPNDNCPNAANPNQEDFDKDGQGNVCDPDSDNDGLTNDYEATIGTNPLDTDSDDDGLNDGEEVNTYGSSPTQKDSDGDGIEDGAEVKNGTNPTINEGAIVTIITSILLDDDCTYYPQYGKTDCEIAKMIAGAGEVFGKMAKDIQEAQKEAADAYQKLVCAVPFLKPSWCNP